MAAAPVPYSSSVEVAPEPAVSTPVEMSSSYVAVPTTAVVPVPVPSYPAGNGTVVAPSGSAPVASGSPASPTGASDTDVAALPEQTVNAAGMVGVPAVGAVIAGLMALFA